MNYKLKLINGDTFTITEEEHKNIITGNKEFINFNNGVTIRRNVISDIFPENKSDEIENRKIQMTGVLHDGTMVKRHFGQWVDASRSVPDDHDRNFHPVLIDPAYYPEVARDCVPTMEKFESEYRQLPPDERLALMIAGTEPKRVGSQPEAIGDLLQKKYGNAPVR